MPRIIAAVEGALAKLPDDDAERTRTRVAGVLSRARPPASNLPPAARKALSSLRKLDDVLVLPADKGRATVVLDRKQYDEKVYQMLSDEETYKELDKDPSVTLERKMNSPSAREERITLTCLVQAPTLVRRKHPAPLWSPENTQA